MNHLGKRICAALLAGAMTMALAACGQSETVGKRYVRQSKGGRL